MGLPSISISFKEKGITAIKRSQRGIVALILKDDKAEFTNPYTIYTTTDIPKDLSDFNKEQIELALMGYQTSPKKVLVYIEKKTAEDYKDILVTLENQRWDYLAIPEIEDSEVQKIATWIKGMRTTKDKKVKAILPNVKADNEGVINFTNSVIKTKAKTFTTAEYCSRIAGLIAGTPMTIACTFAPLPEVIECDTHEKDEYDSKVEAGELFFFNDGEKIKIARGVNSFTTTIQEKGDSFKKIKLVDAMDMIHDDIKKTAEDSYLGKYSNSYDNKCLLISAIQGYFDQLELDGILAKGKNSITIDIEQTKVYLLANGKYTADELAEMTEQEIKEANTGDKVFLIANIEILDAIEDIGLPIAI
jgi:hypothetical protein